MRDLLPEDMLPRERMLQKVTSTFRKWGFSPLSTPAIEFKEVLAGKYGEMADKLIYDLKHKDGLALRYDLTVPLARAVAMYGQELPMPFKRYQIQEVWRAERAQPRQGRFREFVQCDVDTVGTDSLIADGEILALSVTLLKELGFPRAITRVNHREVLKGLIEVTGFPGEKEIEVCRIIDKLDKIGKDGIRSELVTAGFEGESIEKLLDILLRSDADGLAYLKDEYGGNKRIINGIEEMEEVLEIAVDFGVSTENLEFDPTLSRGLDYYTGTIYESYISNQPQIGSLTGGGRYDNLIGLFSGSRVPAVGITIGMDRIIAALESCGKIEDEKTPTRVLVTVFGNSTLKDSIKIAVSLRNEGIPAEVYLDDRRLKHQFSYADKLDIPFVVILGEDEIARGYASLKDMRTGDQTEVTFDELVNRIKSV